MVKNSETDEQAIAPKDRDSCAPGGLSRHKQVAVDEWVTVTSYEERVWMAANCGGGLRKIPLVLEPSPRRLY